MNQYLSRCILFVFVIPRCPGLYPGSHPLLSNDESLGYWQFLLDVNVGFYVLISLVFIVLSW